MNIEPINPVTGKIDHRLVKLGKGPAVHDKRRLRMANYVSKDAGPPPVAVDWTRGRTSWGMMLNDNLGDCTIAGIGHAIQTLTLDSCGDMTTVTDSIIEEYYSKWDGYVVGDPSTDNGGVEPDVLNQWRQSNFNGIQLTAYADPAPQNKLHVKQAITIFGGLYIGLSLPLTAQNQPTWDVVSADDGSDAPGSWGDHCVWVPKYDDTPGSSSAGLICITWGGLQLMTWDFWLKYCDESHALLSPAWLNSENANPNGIDLSTLDVDLESVAT